MRYETKIIYHQMYKAYLKVVVGIHIIGPLDIGIDVVEANMFLIVIDVVINLVA